MEKDQNTGDKTWNNEQKNTNINEGFSGKNIPEDYDPSDGKLKPETEVDDEGNKKEVKRARDLDDYSTEAKSSGKAIKSQKNQENRDKNSDIEPNRYPASHPENHKERGNHNAE